MRSYQCRGTGLGRGGQTSCTNSGAGADADCKNMQSWGLWGIQAGAGLGLTGQERGKTEVEAFHKHQELFQAPPKYDHLLRSIMFRGSEAPGGRGSHRQLLRPGKVGGLRCGPRNGTRARNGDLRLSGKCPRPAGIREAPDRGWCLRTGPGRSWAADQTPPPHSLPHTAAPGQASLAHR